MHVRWEHPPLDRPAPPADEPLLLDPRWAEDWALNRPLSDDDYPLLLDRRWGQHAAREARTMRFDSRHERDLWMLARGHWLEAWAWERYARVAALTLVAVTAGLGGLLLGCQR